MHVMMRDGTRLGENLTREQFVKLDPGKVYDDILSSGCCGAPGFIFQRYDGSIGVEDINSTFLAQEAA